MATTRSKSPRKTSAAKRKAQQAASRQMKAVILFALGVVVTALAIIPGSNVWLWLHSLLLGLFSWMALPVGPFMLYLAVKLSMDQEKFPLAARSWQGILLILLVTAAGQIFGNGMPEEGASLFSTLGEIYAAGQSFQGGGLVGAVLGLPLLHFLDFWGAVVVVLVALFVFAMLITGGTLTGLYNKAKAPVEKMSQVYTDRMESAQQRRRSARFDIDVPLPREEDSREEASLPEEPAPQPSGGAKERLLRAAGKRSAIDLPLPGEETPPPPQPQPEPEPEPEPAPDPDPLDDLVLRAVSGEGRVSSAQEEGRFSFQEEAPVPYSGGTLNRGGQTFQIPDLPGDPLPPDEDLLDGSALFGAPASQQPPQEELPEFLPLELEEDSLPPVEQEADLPPEEEGDKPEPDGAPAAAAEEPAPPPEYVFPPVSLLDASPEGNTGDLTEELRSNAALLVDTLKSFGVQTRVVDISRGPAVTRYELQPSAGVKISRITGLADDIALNLAASGVRIEAPIPNKAAVGIEVPNKTVRPVHIREVIDSEAFVQAASRVSVALGKDIAGKIVISDLAKMPHVLIAGSTGSGKSVCINSIIISILYKAKPEEVKLLMIDPKVVELGGYNGIPHLLVPVVTDPKKAAGALCWAVNEMLRRYQSFSEYGVRDLGGYNRFCQQHPELEPMPQIVIIIDELSDLMMAAPNDVEDYICRLAQMARAAGMHLVIATQRPSVDVITGIIKANIPSRIAFAVSSQVDSRTILDSAGAEKLLGRGDMLYNPVGSAKPTRVQGCFVSDSEVERVVDFVKKGGTAAYSDTILEEIDKQAARTGQKGGGSGDDGDEEDEYLDQAIECVVEAGVASTSLLQRRLKLGYARAARLIDSLEQKGIVGPFEGSKPRQVLISKERWYEMKLQKQDS